MNRIDYDTDWYAVLGIVPTATFAEMRAAYRAAVMDWHADRNPDLDPAICQREMARLNNAWEVLGNEQSRLLYDRQRSLRAPPKQEPAPKQRPEARAERWEWCKRRNARYCWRIIGDVRPEARWLLDAPLRERGKEEPRCH